MAQVIAHRGLRNEKPENTLDSIATALECSGIHGVEFDVELTRDLKPVVLHQETVVPDKDRSRIVPATRDFTSRDWVIEMDATTVSQLDAGSWMGSEFGHLKVPKLKDVLALPWGNVTAFVELKDATYWGNRDTARPAQVVQAVLASLESFSFPLNVISFNPEILRELRKRLSSVATTLALWTEWRSRMNDAIAETKRCGASTISLPDLLVLEEPEWIRAAHDHGLAIHVYPVSPARGEPEFERWTVESQTEKWRALSGMGVDAIITDFARETLAIL